MVVRHVTGLDNVDEDGFIRDPREVRHGTISAGRVEDLASEIDPLTHLNHDFADHQLGECVVVERLAPGASVVVGSDGQFARGRPRSGAFTPLGRVDVGARRVAWLETLRARRDEESGVHR